MTQVLTIRHQQTLGLRDSGHLHAGRDVEVSLRYAALTSGWLARFSGSREGRSALPVLLALALHARPLAGEDFEKLKGLGLVTEEDEGRLYCRVTDVGLADELGLHRTTIPKVMAWLVAERLLHTLPLPAEFSDSRGQFSGARAYLLVADGMMTSTTVTQQGLASCAVEPVLGADAVSVEGTPVSVDVTPVSVQPTPHVRSTVTTHLPGDVASTDTKKIPIREEEEEKKQEGRGFGAVSPLDSESALRLAVAWKAGGGAPPSTEELASLAQLIGPPETGKLSLATLCALLPVWQDGGTRSIEGVLVAASDPAFSRALLLYSQEIGPVTALTAKELWALARRYPDPTRWEGAFRRAVGIPESFRRWRYAQTILEDRRDPTKTVKPATKTHRGAVSAYAASPARSSGGRASDGGRRPQGVWSPEEIERINAEAAARLTAQGIDPYADDWSIS